MTYPHIETAADYAEYQAAFAAGTAGLEHMSSGPCSGCSDCGLSENPTEHERELASEEWFSWHWCDWCNRDLGGMRQAGHAIVNGEIAHYSICSDCVYFLEYGQLDDLAMMELEESN